MKSNIKKLQKILEKARKQNKKVVFYHGCFDGLHNGHLELFQRAKEIGDLVIVGIEKDEYLKRVKGNHRPFYWLEDRIDAILKTGLVDHVFVIPTGDAKIYKKLYFDLKPDFLITGCDEVIQKKKKDAEEAGIKLIIMEKINHSRNKVRK